MKGAIYMPRMDGINKANNPISGSVDLNQELANVMNAVPTTENTAPVAETAPTGGTPVTAGAEMKKKSMWSQADTDKIGMIAVKRKANNSKYLGTNLGNAMEQMQKNTRIVGYVTKTNDRIDFKKTVDYDVNTSNAKVSFVPNHYAPPKPIGVIVKYPQDIFDRVNAAVSGDNKIISSEELSKASSASSYSIAVLPVSANGLFDWASHYCSPNILIEDEAIFEPYVQIGAKNTKVRNAWDNAGDYPTTQGHPGLQFRPVPKSRKKAQSESVKTDKRTGEQYRNIVYTLDTDSDLVIRITNTGRSKWVTPHNYIALRKYKTREQHFGAVADVAEQNSLTCSYFLRYLDANRAFQPKVTKKAATVGAEKVAPKTISTIGAITIEGNSVDTLIASCFKDANYWTTTKVAHWYNAVQVEGGYVRAETVLSDVYFADRGLKDASDASKGYSYRFADLTESAGPNSLADISEQIKSALGSCTLDYNAIKSISTAAASAKSTGKNYDFSNFIGLGFDELRDQYKALIQQTNEMSAI